MKKEFRKLVDDVYLLKTPAGGVWSGIVLVDGEEKILIDSGESAKIIEEWLVPALKALHYTLDDMDWLCNTHCHGDHVGGHRRIVELSRAKVAAYKKATEKVRDPMKYSRLIRAAYPEYSPPAPEGLCGVEPDVVLADGAVVGNRLQVVATPGHDTDCVSFYDIKTRTLITGDSLQGNGTRTQGTALYMNLLDYRDSLEKLKKMELENIISGHPYLFSGEAAYGEGAVSEYLEKCTEITHIYDHYIRGEARAGNWDVPKIAEGLIKYMKNERPRYMFLPLFTVDAHLSVLREGEESENNGRKQR